LHAVPTENITEVYGISGRRTSFLDPRASQSSAELQVELLTRNVSTFISVVCI